MIKHLLPQRQRYFKTALHVHTDVSDGFWSPEELKSCFKEHGFSCVAFSDHNLITDQSQLNDEDFLTLTSYEMGFQEEGNGWYARNVHVNVLAKEPGHLWQAGKPPKLYKNSPQYLDKVEIVDKEYPYSMLRTKRTGRNRLANILFASLFHQIRRFTFLRKQVLLLQTLSIRNIHKGLQIRPLY